MIVDLRSDTVTQPTQGMLDAMMTAIIGDDVLDGDPSVGALEEKCAYIFGMDAAVFCPSGTMTNQIGINLLTQPYDEIICHEGAHIYRYEGGGLAGNALINTKCMNGKNGKLYPDDILSGINDAEDFHQARTSLVALENTVLSASGNFYTLDQIEAISTLARSKGLAMHLDGARIFNAVVASGDSSKLYGKYFDTISICLSKGLGAPVGSVLLCKKHYEKKARRLRKALGGGMRQSGYLAAAGSYALDHHVQRLKQDHDRAKIFGETLSEQRWVESIQPVRTNIIIFTVANDFSPTQILEKWALQNVKGLQWSSREIRLVMHLGIDDAMLDKAIKVTEEMF